MATRRRMLAQARENSTNSVTVFQPASSTRFATAAKNAETEIEAITICNTSGAVAAVRLYMDEDGTTYSEATAILWDVDIAANSSLELDIKWGMIDSSGGLGYRSSVANALTITVWGVDTVTE